MYILLNSLVIDTYKQPILLVLSFVLFSCLLFGVLYFKGKLTFDTILYSIKRGLLLSFFIIMSIILAFSTLLLGKLLISFFPNLKMGTLDGWLSYLGVIFGILSSTLLAVKLFEEEKKGTTLDRYDDAIAYLSLRDIEESSETYGSRENQIFNHTLLLENTSDSPALNFNLNYEKSYFRFLDENKETQIVLLSQLVPYHPNNDLYIAPNTEFRYALVLEIIEENLINELGLYNEKEIELNNFELQLFFEYNTKFSRFKDKIGYSITIHRHQMFMTEWGMLSFFTTKSDGEDWTNLFIGDIVQKYHLPYREIT